MQQPETVQRRAIVIGHRSPDTDSICSAIGYAYLKNKVGILPCDAYRAGPINRETAFVLRHFGMEQPPLVTDVSPQVEDIDIRRQPGVDQNMSLKRAWAMMRDEQIDTLSVVAPDRTLLGVITVKDIATANMDSFDTRVLAQSRTSYANILDTLSGSMVVGDPNATVEKGQLIINASNPELMEQVVEPGDIVMLANRYENQLCAIQLGAACLIVCMGTEVSKTIRTMAREKGCAIISTPYDTYAVGRLISQAAPIGHYMTTADLLTFGLHTPVEEASKVMARVRHRYFPILDEDGKYCGVISRRNLLGLHRKQLILVDHNERTQAVEGFEQADILEIIDHHRIGSLETNSPVYFRNVPVGCTATIVRQLFAESGVSIPANIAGLLLSAILSDTLMFRSPTCTPQDEEAAHALAALAGEDIEAYADAMFEAGGNVTGKSAEDVFLSDFKIFTSGDVRFGVGQGSYMTKKTQSDSEALVRPYLETAAAKQNLPLVFYMFTDVRAESTRLAFYGHGAAAVVETAFGQIPEDGVAVLPGVVSRKKQVIPRLITAIEQQ